MTHLLLAAATASATGALTTYLLIQMETPLTLVTAWLLLPAAGIARLVEELHAKHQEHKSAARRAQRLADLIAVVERASVQAMLNHSAR
ncbi:hypothetical protein ACIBH1_45525 [Nonomuraea sp. NPDC050663]|uniref:hypothetical protein n=1 Tax=Nonomuraea sp. NPDC050663 TaxID=3364370 RepID=UPI00379B2D10